MSRIGFSLLILGFLAVAAPIGHATVEASNGAAPSQPQIEWRKVEVRRGETLQSVSMRLYGTTRKWKDLFQWNRHEIQNFDKVEVGALLRAMGPFVAEAEFASRSKIQAALNSSNQTGSQESQAETGPKSLPEDRGSVGATAVNAENLSEAQQSSVALEVSKVQERVVAPVRPIRVHFEREPASESESQELIGDGGQGEDANQSQGFNRDRKVTEKKRDEGLARGFREMELP